MNTILKIHPDFEKVIPALSSDEFAQLEENILSEGKIIDPLIVWNGYIIDGHNRYRIAQKHPHINFSVHEKDFDSENEALIWICSHQLGRRNITEAQRQYLIGQRYEAEKNLHGGDRRSEAKISSVQIGHLKNEPNTRKRIAEETHTNESYVKNCDRFRRGLDEADTIIPGIRQEVLSGMINPTKSAIYEIPKLPLEEKKQAVENLRLPREQTQCSQKKTKKPQQLIVPNKRQLKTIKKLLRIVSSARCKEVSICSSKHITTISIISPDSNLKLSIANNR